MLCDGVRRGIPHVGGAFHFGFASPKSAHGAPLESILIQSDIRAAIKDYFESTDYWNG